MTFARFPGELQTALAVHSSYIESVLCHRMIADLSCDLWKRNCNAPLQIFHSEVDNAGFDLVIKLGSLIRYVQLKQANSKKKGSAYSTRASFSKLAGSCIVLMIYDADDLSIAGYRFFGNKPHDPMPSIDSFTATKSPGRRNAKGERHIRAHYRNVPMNKFTSVQSVGGLFDLLFPSGLEPTILTDADLFQDVHEFMMNDDDNEMPH